MIKGNKVELIPVSLDDRKRVYEWCFQSEITKSHAGPPDYPDIPITTLEEFCDDYEDYFFTGSHPEHGRGFVISHQGEPVGFISYSASHLLPHKAELDIWMNSEANCGKGFGVDAIAALGEYLNQTMGIQELIMRPSIKNVRAMKSYEKAGLQKSDRDPSTYLREEFLSLYGEGDYGPGETVLLIKTFGA